MTRAARRRLALALACALLCAASPPPAPTPPADRPLTLPTRDVDVTYRLGQINPATAPAIIEQRLRWDAASGMLRVDPPTPGLYVILDTHTRQMTTVRTRDRTILVLDGVGPAAGGLPGGGGKFIREGESRVASLTCTQWLTTDLAGAPALICVTADGVMLRAVTAGRTVLEATKVTYGPLDPAIFQPPAGYTRHETPAAVPASRR
jgi:hypothetical protein